MKRYLYISQTGEGCDYTVGCGNALIPLKSTCDEDLRKEIQEHFKDWGCYEGGSRELDQILILSDKDVPRTLAQNVYDDYSSEVRDKIRERELTDKQRQIQRLEAELAALKGK